MGMLLCVRHLSVIPAKTEIHLAKFFFCKVEILCFLMYNRGCLDLCMNNPSGVLLYTTPPGKARQNQHYCMSLDNPRRGRRSMRNEERG